MILIVDDMQEIVEWLVETVGEAGYYADYAMDSYSALYKMERIHYAMALIDIRIPGMDGNELARHVKTMPEPFCTIPIVAMTGGRTPFSDGLFVATLKKPFLARDLRAVITKHARPPIDGLHANHRSHSRDG
jgi:CheY-like chemotaxis protein